ncbi:MAG: MetS family NSS transporter small subunit [Firmicutes bacterium]|jgi:hypothetical protein|nr:MetS family NSS transporter small subunit [Bacillota bacterium]NBI63434.1 MetS family NSS transporter small subunit [Clostridiales bacterium]
MSAGAIVMLLIAAIGLWGGCGVSIAIAMKHSKKNKPQAQEAADAGEQK